METSFDLLLWRNALAKAAPVPSERDLSEWAMRLTDAGEYAASTLLEDVSALHQGFSPQAIANRGPARPFDPFSACSATNEGWTLHRALAELRGLARLADVSDRPRFAEAPALAASGRPDNPAGIGDGVPAPATINDIADTASRLRSLMESASVDEKALRRELSALVEADHRHPELDYRTFAQAPLVLLVPVIATIGLIDFALSTQDLWNAPLGSPKVFHHVARLDSVGLGPYLTNIGRLVRNSGDVIDLARLAQRSAKGVDADIMPWIVLLSRGCRRELLYELVDDLGDIGAGGALTAILEREISRPAAAIDRSLVMRLRDAGLDNADFRLAARAQQVIAELSPDNALEGLILGEIEASGGDFARAEAIFRYWLIQSPNDQVLRERLMAVIKHRFDRFALVSGFGSPADRRDTRLRRRGVPADYPRRFGERIRAVDVG